MRVKLHPMLHEGVSSENWHCAVRRSVGALFNATKVDGGRAHNAGDQTKKVCLRLLNV